MTQCLQRKGQRRQDAIGDRARVADVVTRHDDLLHALTRDASIHAGAGAQPGGKFGPARTRRRRCRGRSPDGTDPVIPQVFRKEGSVHGRSMRSMRRSSALRPRTLVNVRQLGTRAFAGFGLPIVIGKPPRRHAWSILESPSITPCRRTACPTPQPGFTARHLSGNDAAIHRCGAPDVMSGDRALALGAARRAATRRRRPSRRRGRRSRRPPGLAYFEDCPDAILRFNAERRVVYANPAVERATAVSRWQFIDHRLEEVEHFADFAPLWNESLAAVSRRTKDAGSSFPIRIRPGRSSSMSACRWKPASSRRHTHVTAVLRDITVPKSALRATRAAAEFVESLLASASIGIGVLDRDCVYRVWNEHLESLLGVAAEAVLGRAFDDAPGACRTGRAGRRSAAAGERSGAACRSRSRPAYPDGERPWLRVKLTPVFDPNGSLRWRVHHGRADRS